MDEEGKVGAHGSTRSEVLKRGAGAALGLAAGSSLLRLADAGAAYAATKTVARGYQRGVKKGGAMVVATGDGLGNDLFVGNSFGPAGFAYHQFAWGLWTYAASGRRLVPGVAQGYRRSRDGLVHDIGLRPGMKFHDGSPITANAVAANLRAAFTIGHPLRGPGIYLMIPLFWGGFPGIVRDIRVTGRGSIRMVLSEPRADIRSMFPFLPIFNPAVLADKTYGTDVEALRNAGSGPFRVVNFRPGQFVEFEQVPGFVEEAYLKRLRLQLVPDASARFLALRSGQAHVAIGLSNADWNSVVDNRRYRTFVSFLGNNNFLALNAQKTELLGRSKDVRRAIQHALNRAAYVRNYWGKGIARVGTQIALGRGVNGYNPRLRPAPYNPAAAEALLRRAGVRDLKLTVVNPRAFASVPELAAMLQAMKGDLERVGIGLTINLTDVPGWLAGLSQNDTWVAPFGGSLGNGVGIASLQFLSTTPPRPSTHEMNDLLRSAATSLSAAERDAKLRRLMALAVDHVSGIPISDSLSAAAAQANVRNYSVSAAPVDPLHRTWIA